MGKIKDDRVVEYAYDMRIIMYPNVEYTETVIEEGAEPTDVTKYKHKFTMTYELKDVDGTPIGFEKKEHEVLIGEEKDDVAKKIVKIAGNLKPFIREDKLALSGYDIGE